MQCFDVMTLRLKLGWRSTNDFGKATAMLHAFNFMDVPNRLLFGNNCFQINSIRIRIRIWIWRRIRIWKRVCICIWLWYVVVRDGIMWCEPDMIQIWIWIRISTAYGTIRYDMIPIWIWYEDEYDYEYEYEYDYEYDMIWCNIMKCEHDAVWYDE